jgi:hypothetical protein
MTGLAKKSPKETKRGPIAVITTVLIATVLITTGVIRDPTLDQVVADANRQTDRIDPNVRNAPTDPNVRKGPSVHHVRADQGLR